MVQMSVHPEPTSPTMTVSSLSDHDLVRKVVAASASSTPTSASLSAVPSATTSGEPPFGSELPPPLPSHPSSTNFGRSTHPLLKPQPQSAPPRPPSDHPLLGGSGGPSYPPRQSSDHPLLLSGLSPQPQPPSSSSGHTRSASSGLLLLDGGHTRSGSSSSFGHSRSGSVGAALPLPPRSGRRGARAGRSHRRVHSLPSAGAAARREREVAAAGGSKDGDAGRSLEELMAKLEERRRKYGDVHPRVGLAHNSIGNYHFRRGDLSTAAKSYSNALECFKAADSSSDFNGIGSSSSSLSSCGSSSSAPELRQQLDIAVALGNLGAVLWSTGKLAEAVESLEKGIEIRARVDAIKAENGIPLTERDTADMSNAQYSLGLALSLCGEYDGAMDALDRARDCLSSHQESSPVGVRGRSYSYSRLRIVERARIEDAKGKVHLLRGDPSSAVGCHLRALEAKSAAALGPSHPSVLATRSNVAAAYRVMGRLEEAATMFRDVLAARKVALYEEKDQDAKKRIIADVGATMRAIGEVQRERQTAGGVFAGGGTITDFMASIVEERERGIALGAEDDWGLSGSQS